MAGVIESAANGTSTCAGLNTPLTLATLTNYGVYELRVNLNNMAASDTIRFLMSDGDSIVTELASYSNDQSPDGKKIGPVIVYDSETTLVRMEQTAGTLRAVAWRLRRVYDDTVAD